MNKQEVKQQIQEDILTILEGFEVDRFLDGGEYNSMVNALCETVINNINKLND